MCLQAFFINTSKYMSTCLQVAAITPGASSPPLLANVVQSMLCDVRYVLTEVKRNIYVCAYMMCIC